MSTYKIPVQETFEYQSPVLDKDLTAPPGGESKGDRYIVASGGSGAWSGEDDSIATYNGSGWDFVSPVEGMITYISDEHKFYQYLSSWEEIGTAADLKDAITKKHTQNTDTALNTGGSNFVSASEIVKNIYNTLLNSFKLAIQGSLTIFNMVDGIVDEFEDESGIDNDASTNEEYDATNDLYAPTSDAGSDIINQSSGAVTAPLGDGGGVEYREAQSFQLDDNYSIASVMYKLGANTGSPTGNHTIRIETDNAGLPSGILAHANATKVITPVANSTNTATFDNTFILAASTVYWLVILCDNQANNNYWNMLYDAANPYANGMRVYSADGGSTWAAVTAHDFVFKVTSAPSINNMILISESFVAEAVPGNARIVLFEEDVDSMTINTDLKVYVSRDGGTTYTQFTLTDEGNYDATKRILISQVDISAQPSDTSMKYKIETLNNKDCNLHGVGLLWD